jgi:hypothetical protein
MANLILSGSTSGSVTLSSPAVSGTTTLTLPTTSGTVGIVSGDLGTPSALVGTNISGTANSLNAGIGVNQTWTDVTASRAIGTTYTNSTGKPILVSMTFSCNTVNTVQGLTINGVVVYCTGIQVASQPAGFTLLVPNGGTYVTVTNLGTLTKITWAELR